MCEIVKHIEEVCNRKVCYGILCYLDVTEKSLRQQFKDYKEDV